HPGVELDVQGAHRLDPERVRERPRRQQPAARDGHHEIGHPVRCDDTASQLAGRLPEPVPGDDLQLTAGGDVVECFSHGVTLRAGPRRVARIVPAGAPAGDPAAPTINRSREGVDTGARTALGSNQAGPGRPSGRRARRTRRWTLMRIGSSIALIVIGAILAFAVSDVLDGVDLTIVGYILMAGGLVGLILRLVLSTRRSRSTTTIQQSGPGGVTERRMDSRSDGGTPPEIR